MKYRKKPVVVEAMQFDGSEESAREIALWSGRTVFRTRGGAIAIEAPEGTMIAKQGDRIIKEVTENLTISCNPDIFANTYEAVEE